MRLSLLKSSAKIRLARLVSAKMNPFWILFLTFLIGPSGWAETAGKSNAAPEPSADSRGQTAAGTATYGCTEDYIKHYVARRADGPVTVDGQLEEASWQKAEKSPSFADMVTGEPALYDTQAAVLWDNQYLYVAFWMEEPFVRARLTENNSLIFQENDAEVFIDGGDSYYEFETNALGTTYQVFYIWRDAYKKGGRFDAPEFDVLKHNALTFGGDYDRQAETFWKGTHPRGIRYAFLGWDFPGLLHAVRVDGKINDSSARDRSWTVELAFPWTSMKGLAGNRSLPPHDGDVWKIFFGRFELLRTGGVELEPHPAWSWSRHGVYDTHLPECFTAIHISDQPVGK